MNDIEKLQQALAETEAKWRTERQKNKVLQNVLGQLHKRLTLTAEQKNRTIAVTEAYDKYYRDLVKSVLRAEE